MNIKSTWNNANKGLLALLGILIFATIGTLIYLTTTLLNVHRLVNQGGIGVGKVIVLQDLLMNVQNLQSSTRGYVVTGDSGFLVPYEAAMASIPADMRILKSNEQVSLAPQQVERIQALVDRQTAFARQVFEMRRDHSFEAAQVLVASKQGEDSMNALRKEIAGISSRGLQDIGPMQRRSEQDIRHALVVSVAVGVLVLGTCAAVLWYFRRSILQERALESTKSEFLSLASHQLRTPATNVKQYLSLVMDGYMGDLTEQQQKALAIAYKNNEAEIKIMNDLLDVAKLDLNRIQLHKKITNVMHVAKAVVRDYKPRAAERGQTINLKGSSIVMASVDAEYIRGILQNLLDNALKYSHDDKPITVRVEREQDMISISIKDKGVGIKKRDYSKLFNKFSRLANEFSANSEGSGLGLYWVKQVVDLHGGRIDVESREGKGSNFTIYLPVR